MSPLSPPGSVVSSLFLSFSVFFLQIQGQISTASDSKQLQIKDLSSQKTVQKNLSIAKG